MLGKISHMKMMTFIRVTLNQQNYNQNLRVKKVESPNIHGAWININNNREGN